jgi:hypothetical protein
MKATTILNVRKEGAMPTRGRPKRISNQPNTTKLFADDRRELISLSSNEKKSMSVVIRELVHEALRERRLRAIGRDEKDDFFRNIQRELITQAIHPLSTEVSILRQSIDAISTKSVWEERAAENQPSEFDQAALALLRILLSRVMVTENLGRILVTVGMQKDNIKNDEIQKLLSTQDHDGHRQAEAMAQKILSQFSSPNTKQGHTLVERKEG